MNSIDERIVEMQFNNGEFEKGIQESLKSLDALKKGLELDKSSKSLENLEKMISHVDFSAMSKGIETISNRFTNMGIVGMRVIENLTDKVMSFAERTVRSISVDQISAGFSKYAQKTEAVQTIMSATNKSVDEVEEVLKRLNDYTDWTSFNFAEMTSTIGKFTSSGVDLDVAERAMEGIGNEASLAGASIQSANHAMYNFAQALSAGKVQLMDWKSIENANMATKQFKDTIIETAIELGTLQQVSEGVGKTTKGTEVDFRSFNTTLSEGWFTSDVLIKTLEKYADTTTELGKKAFDAAKKAITFGQAMDSVRDAVSTGWMNTFQLIFGNFEEASKLWTGFADGLIEITDAFSSARNELLTGWRDFNGEDGRAILLDGLIEIYEVICDIVKVGGDVFRSLFPPITSEHLMNFSKAIKGFADNLKETFGLIEIMVGGANSLFTGGGPEVNLRGNIVEKLETLERILQRGSKNDDVKKMQERLMALGYSLDKYGADGIFGPETEAALKKFQEEAGLVVDGIYGPKSHEALGERLRKDISETTEPLAVAEQYIYNMTSGMEKLQRIFRGVFSVLHIGVKVGQFALNVIKQALSLLKPLGNVLLTVGAVIGDCFAALDASITESNLFGKALEKVTNFLKPFGEWIDRISKSIVNFFEGGEPIKNFTELWQRLSDAVKKSKFWDQMLKAFEKIKQSKYFDQFSKFFETGKAKIKGFVSSLKNFFTSAAKGEKPTGKFGVALEKIQEIFAKISGFFGDVPGHLADAFIAVTDFIGSIIESAKSSPLISGFLDKIGNFFMLIKTKGSEFFQNVPQYAERFKNFFKSLIPADFSLSDAWSNVVSKISDFFSGLSDKLDSSGKLKQAWDNTKRVFQNIINELHEFADLLLEAIKRFFSSDEATGGSTSLFTAGGDKEAALGTGAMKTLADRFEAFGDVVDWLKSKWEFLEQKFTETFESITTFFSNLKNNTGEGMTSIGEGFNGVLQGLINFFSGVWKEIKILAPLIVGVLAGFSAFTALKQLTKFLKGFRKDVQPLGVTILEVAGAIALVAGSLYVISKIETGSLVKAGVVIGSIVAVLAAFVVVSKVFSEKDAAKATMLGKSMMSVAGSIAIIAGVASILSIIPWKNLLTGLAKTGAVMAALLVFILAVQAVNKLTGQKGLALVGLIGVAGAIAILSGLAILLSLIKPEQFANGLKQVTKVMLLLLGFIIAYQLVIQHTGGAAFKFVSLLAVVGAIGILAVIARLIGGFKASKFKSGLKRIAAIMVLLLGFIAALAVVNKKIGGISGAGLNLVTLGSVIAAIYILAKIVESFGKMDPAQAKQGIVALLAISGCLTVLSLVAALLGSIGLGAVLSGALGLIAVAGAMAVAFALFSAIATGSISDLSSAMFSLGSGLKDYSGMINGIAWSQLYDSLDFLTKFCEWAAVNSGFNAQSVANISSGLNRIGYSVMRFKERIGDTDSGVVDFLKDISDAIVYMETTLKGGNAIGASLAIATIGGAIALFYDGLKNIDTTNASTALTDIGSVFQQIADSLPNDADISRIESFGSNASGSNLSLFAIGIENIGTAMEKYSEIAEKVKLGKMMASTVVLSYFAGLNERLTKLAAADGVLASLTGIQDPVSKFSEDIGLLGQGLSDYATEIGSNENFDLPMLQAANGILNEFIGMQANLEATGGIIQTITGWKNLGNLASNMSALGKGLANYASSVADVSDWSQVPNSTRVIGALSRAQSNLNTTGGLWGLLAGDTSLGDFANNMGKLGSGVAAYANAVSGTTFDKSVSTSVSVIGDLATVQADLMQWYTGSQTLASFGEQLELFTEHLVTADANLADYTGDHMNSAIAAMKEAASVGLLLQRTNFTSGLTSIADDIQEFYQRMTTGFDTSVGESIVSAITEMINAVPTSVEGTTQALSQVGADISNAIGRGISQNSGIPRSMAIAMMTSVKSTISGRTSGFDTIGRQIVQGLANGIRNGRSLVVSAAADVISAAIRTANLAAEISSPSRKFAEIGMFMDLGLAKGLKDYSNVAELAASGVAESTIETTRNLLSQLASLEGLGVDSTPTITPVLDLSNISSGAGRISGLLSGYGISLGHRGSYMTAPANSVNADVVNAIGVLNARVNELAEAMTHLQVVTETGALVGAIAPEMDRKLGQRTTQKRRLG